MRYTIRPLGAWTLPVTESRQSSGVFRASWDRTLRDLDYELNELGASGVVFQIDVQEGDVRLDGMLRNNAKVSFPGVKVSFESKFGPLTYATDAYEQRWSGDMPGWQANIRAIALGLKALRAVDRYGITKRGEQYVGWKALPPGGTAVGSASHMMPSLARDIIRTEAGLDGAPLTGSDELAQAIRMAKARSHPDRHHGDRSRWDAVEQAALVLQRSA